MDVGINPAGGSDDMLTAVLKKIGQGMDASMPCLVLKRFFR